jgi:hypothetical protein
MIDVGGVYCDNVGIGKKTGATRDDGGHNESIQL